MPHINKRRGDTRMQIIRAGAKHFIENGYSKTTMKLISRELDLSPGNITFYFPTKDHLLAVLVQELFDFQDLMMKKAAADEWGSLFAFCLEFVATGAACAESEIARDFYTAAYTSPYTLDLIKKNDAIKARTVFGEYCRDFSDRDWDAAQALVSGIEYGAVMTSERSDDLYYLLEKALDTVLSIYRVPKEPREQCINRVLSLDYKALGKRILLEFHEYIDKANT